MSFVEQLILRCDKDPCDAKFVGNLGKKRFLLNKASYLGWKKYYNSDFCPECWPEIEKFLKGEKPEPL